ncbi:MAG: hypothetical protein ACNA7Q_04945, partial [Rhodobacterales bacterium]
MKDKTNRAITARNGQASRYSHRPLTKTQGHNKNGRRHHNAEQHRGKTEPAVKGVNLHSKLTHLRGSKAHRRACYMKAARLWALLFLVQGFVRDLLWAKRKDVLPVLMASLVRHWSNDNGERNGPDPDRMGAPDGRWKPSRLGRKPLATLKGCIIRGIQENPYANLSIKNTILLEFNGAAEGTRTPDPIITN